MSKKFISLLVVIAAITAAVLALKYSNLGAQAVWGASAGGKWLLPIVVIAALIDSINPCAFSILLLTIAFLFSLGKIRSGILKIGFSYIAGLFVVYILIGLGILQALSFFGVPHFMAKAGATLLIVLGAINLANHFFPSFPVKLRIPAGVHTKMADLMEKSSAPTAFALGALVGVCEFPCTGGPYLMILGLLHDQGTRLVGLSYLLLYNLVFVLPLVVILLLASEAALLEKVQSWKRSETGRMKLWGGIAMIALGLLIFAF